MTGRHAIITQSDARCGEFLEHHWLRSLQSHVTLRDVDVHVLDYGLQDDQRERLRARGVHCHRSTHDGHITNIRYRDMARVLAGGHYDQALLVDGGDVIFQADIRPLFDQHTDRFRAVCHELEVPFHEVIMSRADFARDRFRSIADFLRDKPTINGGFVLGPASKMASLWERFAAMADSFAQFGIDQFLLNYVLHADGFVELESKFNFSIMARASAYRIRSGTFYDARGEIIPVVHNSGIYEPTRPVARFGYGADRNRPRRIVPALLRAGYHTFNLLRWSEVARKRAGRLP
jgi:hypothetical protein